MKIGVFGSGYVGLVTAACLANLGHEVLCCDIDEAKVAKLQKGEVHFFEPGLKDLVKKVTERGRLTFTTKPEETVKFGEVLFNCVGTPMQDDGSADLSAVMAVAETVAKHCNGDKVLVNKSTVPPGTARKATERINSKKPSHKITLVSNPEFLKEGAAVHDFNHPDRIVIGAETEDAYRIMKKVYSGLLRIYIPVVETTWETSETIKYANNCFLATKISFVNEIANVCDVVGADVRMVAQALGLDYRVSSRFLSPGVGYGGSCFPKDVNALIYRAKQGGYDAKLLQEVHEFNERQKLVLLSKLKKHISDLKGKTIGILGLSFKPKTSDIREAPSLVIIKELLGEGANVKAYDPEANEEAKEEFGDKITFLTGPYKVAQDADAILLVTEWDEFRSLDLERLKSVMKGNIFCDGRNVYEREEMEEAGLVYEAIGR